VVAIAYLALYRQHRPRTLAEVVDQDHIVRTLRNALNEGRMVHAYLFTGPRGTGKTSVARVLARSLNCIHGPTADPCGICPSCVAIDSGSAVDVREIDAASNRGIDDIRELRQSLQYIAESRYRIFIIDEVHMLSPEAFNALLKTLEEPPPQVVFILATTEVHKIPLTILSRCQRFDFHRIGKKAMIAHLQQVLQKSERGISLEALDILTERSGGGMRDALSMLDQCLIFTSGDIQVDDLLAVIGSVDQRTMFALLNMVLHNDIPAMLSILDTIEDAGRDLVQLLYDLMRLLRSLMITPQSYAHLLAMSSEQALLALDYLSRAEADMKYVAWPRLSLELALLRIAEEIPYGGRIQALEARLASLEARQEGGTSSAPAAHVSPATSTRSRSSVKPVAVAATIPQENLEESLVSPIASSAHLTPEPLPMPKSAATPREVVSGERWSTFMAQIKREKVSLHGILVSGRLFATSNNLWELVFEHDFHYNQVNKPENKNYIEDKLSALCGSPQKFKSWLLHELATREASPAIANDDLIYQAAVALVGSDRVRVEV